MTHYSPQLAVSKECYFEFLPNTGIPKTTYRVIPLLSSDLSAGVNLSTTHSSENSKVLTAVISLIISANFSTDRVTLVEVPGIAGVGTRGTTTLAGDSSIAFTILAR